MLLKRGLWNFSFFGRRDISASHSELCRFVSGSQAKHQVSSPVIILLKNFVCIGHRDKVLARRDSIYPLFRCQGLWNKTCTQLSLSQILFQNPTNYSLGDVQRFCYHCWWIRRSFLNKSATAAIFNSVRVDFGQPLSRHLLSPSSVSKSRIPPKNVWSVQSLIPISLLHQ